MALAQIVYLLLQFQHLLLEGKDHLQQHPVHFPVRDFGHPRLDGVKGQFRLSLGGEQPVHGGGVLGIKRLGRGQVIAGGQKCIERRDIPVCQELEGARDPAEITGPGGAFLGAVIDGPGGHQRIRGRFVRARGTEPRGPDQGAEVLCHIVQRVEIIDPDPTREGRGPGRKRLCIAQLHMRAHPIPEGFERALEALGFQGKFHIGRLRALVVATHIGHHLHGHPLPRQPLCQGQDALVLNQEGLVAPDHAPDPLLARAPQGLQRHGLGLCIGPRGGFSPGLEV